MQVGELLEILKDYPEEMEVKLAQQPKWPFQYSVGRIVDANDADDNETCLFIAEGEQEDYLGDDAAARLAWSE